MPFAFLERKESTEFERKSTPSEAPEQQGETCATVSRARSARHAADGAPGLVSSQTSGTALQICPRMARLQRMKRRVLTACRLHGLRRIGAQCIMLTLTYRPGAEWQSRHVSECMRHIRQWCRRRGVAHVGCWVAEIQEARKKKTPDFHCVHYHVLLWLPRGVKLPRPDAQGWWPHGMTRIESVRHAIGYIAKYASKGSDCSSLPAGARMYAVIGLDGPELDEARWWALPTWLREEVSIGEPVRRRKGGGWIHLETGEVLLSPWRVLFKGGKVWLIASSP